MRFQYIAGVRYEFETDAEYLAIIDRLNAQRAAQVAA